MPVQEEIYTISDADVLTSDARRRKSGRVLPDWRPSASVRGPSGGAARPLVASSLSLFVSGAGQAYNGQGQLGLLFFLFQALGAAANWAIADQWTDLIELSALFGWNEWQLFRGLILIDAGFVSVILAGIFQAYRRAERDTGGFDGLANPLVSGMASLLLPGWGQLVNAQVGKALVFLSGLLAGGGVLALLTLTPLVRILGDVDPSGLLSSNAGTAAIGVLGASAMLWVLSVYDAVLVAGYRRRMS
jgi:TM2 domain-containing membrane protein YozV